MKTSFSPAGSRLLVVFLLGLIAAPASVIAEPPAARSASQQSAQPSSASEAAKGAAGADAKPAVATDSVPGETKDAKPVDSKSAETKPAEAKPADAKPAETKPTDTKEPAAAKEADKKKTPEKVVVVPRSIAGSAFDPCPSASDDCPLRSALLHHKFGIVEHGNVKEYDLACEDLEVASSRIEAGDPLTRESMAWQVEHVKREVLEMRRMARRSLFGRFPLLRAFGVDTGDEEDLQVHSYVVPGDARRRAIRSALTQLAKSASADPLHVAILVPGVKGESNDKSAAYFAELVDAEARNAFLNIANFQLYPGTLRLELGPIPDWDAADPAYDPICRQFLARIAPDKQPRSVMLVLVRELVDETGDRHWVQAQQRTFFWYTLEGAKDKPADLENDKVRVSESLTHDRSRFTFPVLCGIGLLFVAALLGHAGLSRTFGQPLQGWLRSLVVPACGYTIGFALTPLIMLALDRWLPHPDAHALSAAWWPCAAGGLSLLLPAGVFRLAAGAAGRNFPAISCHGRWGTAFVPVALGVCAAWIRPAGYALGMEAVHVILAMSVTAGLLVFCFGRAIDLADRFPFAVAPIALLLSLVFGAGAFLGSPSVLWGVAGCATLMSLLDSVSLARRSSTAVVDDDAAEAKTGARTGRPQTLEQLLQAVEAPRYLPNPDFKRWIQSIVVNGLDRTTWLGIAGPSAAGKTAAAAHLIDTMRSTGDDVHLVAGHCTENAVPYQVIREAFGSLGLPAGLVSASHGGEVNSVFERLADELIPFWDFFAGAADDSGEETSQRDLLGAITNTLYTLSSKQRVLLFLDDIQWMDEGSLAVLRHLRESFPPGDSARLIVILASRDVESLQRFDLEENIISLKPPSVAEQVRILERSLGIEKTSATHLINALGNMGQEDEGMFWVMRAVREAVMDQAFVVGSRGFTLRKRYLTRSRLPVPSAMRTKLVESLRASGTNLPVLECAALLGEQFRVDELAEFLGMDRLELLQTLRHLERDLQLVRDISSDPESYKFASTFLFETVREELGLGRNNRRAEDSSKLAREYHARIARMLEQRTPRTRDVLYRIAQHYFQAGPSQAASAAEFCLAATRAARREHAFKDARRYLSMAEHSSHLARLSLNLADERRQLDEAETQSRNSPTLSASTATENRKTAAVVKAI